MDHTDYPFEVDEWLRDCSQRIKAGKIFIGDRPYRHFDGRVTYLDFDTNRTNLVPTLKDPNQLTTYSFLPFLRKDKKVRRYTQLKVGQKLRPIMYASHRDSCIYAFFSFLLKRAYEDSIKGSLLDQAVVAYRHIPRDDLPARGKSNIDFANEVSLLAKKHPRCVVLCLDISKFFDSMDHDLIEKRWIETLGFKRLPPNHLAVFRNITNYRYVFLNEALIRLRYGELDKKNKGRFVYYKRGRSRRGPLCSPPEYRSKIDSKVNSLVHRHKSTKGIPQGSPISDAIANIYLQDFDNSILDILSKYSFGYYRRYSDDILIICPEDKTKEIYEFTLNSIEQDKLIIKPEKSEVVLIDNKKKTVNDITYSITKVREHKSYARQAFQYLGFEIDALDMHIRSGTVAAHYRRAKKRAELASKKTRVKSKTKKQTKRRGNHWQYFINAKNRTSSKRISSQYKRVVRRSKKMP